MQEMEITQAASKDASQLATAAAPGFQLVAFN